MGYSLHRMAITYNIYNKCQSSSTTRCQLVLNIKWGFVCDCEHNPKLMLIELTLCSSDELTSLVADSQILSHHVAAFRGYNHSLTGSLPLLTDKPPINSSVLRWVTSNPEFKSNIRVMLNVNQLVVIYTDDLGIESLALNLKTDELWYLLFECFR